MFKLSFITLALLLSTHILAIQSPHGPNLSIKCNVCHSTDSWTKIKANAFNHDQTDFPLVGQHKVVECRKCHADLVFSNAKSDCNACHNDLHQQTVGQDCERCHTPTAWILKDVTRMHNQSRFPLNGQHARIDCYQCHKSASLLRFDPMRSECVDCHLKDYNATTNPSHIASKFPKDCNLCHNEQSWQSSTFDHNTTAFPLEGAHSGIDCNKCHANGYTGTSTACVSCHKTNYDGATNPNHLANNFSTDCQTCHKVTSWQPSTFNHNNTAFPLTGSHFGVDCIKCHANGYISTPSTCVSCHQTNFNATTNPNHVTAKFSTDCQTCHNVIAWQPSTFNHNTGTTFPLTGSHIGVDCIKCHANGYAGTSTTCVSCHQANYNATTNPNHVTSKFSTECQTCHNVTAWQPSNFNHNTTAFPLTGSHIGVDCIKCHANGYVSTPSTCVSCHQANYNATTNPNHLANKFSTECQTCHNVTAWQPSNFNHNTTAFPLTGSHIGVDCIKCHANGYVSTPSTCVSCHQTNFNATTNPNHITAKFSTDCQTCHNAIAWQPSTFNHNTTTTFPLTGSHIGVDCIKCHANGYAGTSTTCVSCHQAKYNATTNPNHLSNKFSTDCQTCHNAIAWQPSTFNHNTTAFPLTGSHIGVACITCHEKGYAGIPTTCVSCHQANFNVATNPNHVAAKFSTECQTCHNAIAWQPSTFNHNTATTFPLKGGHIGVDCIKCHTSGYAGISTTCVSCHLTTYNATTNPAHATAKFPTTCETCHTVNAWTPSTFNHSTYFPITTSRHNVSCTICHTTPTNYALFTCLTASCHPKSSTDSDHRGESGYVYNSTNCYSCHPRGSN